MSKRKRSSVYSKSIESLDCDFEDREEIGVTDYVDYSADAIVTFNFAKAPLRLLSLRLNSLSLTE
jgi:hypothetical protein